MKIVSLKNLALLSVLASLMTFGSANASNVGVLDIENIVKNSAVMKDMQGKIAKKQGEYQKEIDKKQTVLEAEGKKLDAKKGISSEEGFNKEQVAFDKKVGDLREHLEKRQLSLQEASKKAMSAVNDKLKVIIADISKERKLDVIIPTSQALYYDPALDISAEVLKKLNEKITKVDVKFE